MSIRTYNTVARKMASTRHTLGILFGYGWSMARVWLEYAYTMARVCLGANILFPGWEQNIPTLGTKHSQAGNKTGLRLALDEITARHSRDYGSCLTTLRLVVTLLLVMVVGVNEMWGQDVDFSGTYYIASDGNAALANGNADNSYHYNSSTPQSNYYLVPASDPPSGNETTAYFDGEDAQKPFLTTYKTDRVDEAVWVITQVIDNDGTFYYIKHSSGKYVVYEKFFTDDTYWRRKCMHLEGTSIPNGDIGKFVITYNFADGYYNIVPKSLQTSTHKYWNISDKNRPYKYGYKTNDYYYGGMLGVYSGATDVNSKWKFEDKIKRPTICYDASGNIIITNNATSAKVYYSIGGDSDPKTSGTELSGTTETLTSFEDGTIIKAVAKVGDEYSNVVTFTAVVHVGSSNQYLIQNLERTDFYMIPGDVSNNNTYVNTTSLFRPTMSWYFSDAGSVGGVQYYYIINGSTGDYLYFASNNVYMRTSSVFDAATDKTGYMFSIVQGYSDAEKNNPDGFHIVPKSQISANEYSIYKGGWSSTTPIANASADAMKGSTNGRQPGHKHTRWKFVLPSTLDKTPPFTVTDAITHITKFYKIASVGSSGYYIVPPTGNNINATTSNSADAAVVKSGTWYFEKAQDATDADWCTYYYIRNAETGKYLYFTKDGTDYATNPKACLEMRETKSGDEDPYLFTWARTAEENVNYYIVPKKLKDVSLNKIGTLQRSGNTLQSDLRRDAGNYAWTFEDAALFCSNPIFEESGDNIVISCILGSAEIHYTTNGDDPSADGATYSVYPPATPLSASDKHLIKACAVVSDGATPTPNTASSEVITFIKNPDVTFTEGNEIPYAGGAAVEPIVSSVTITPEGGSTITIDATEYSVAYSNNTDVGEATVTISDALPENNIIISGTSHFTITPKSLGNGSTAADGITITLTKIGENEYSVTVKNGTITLTQYDANNPTASYDYTVSGTPDESGFVATVEAKKEGDVYTGNYTGKAKAVYVKANFPTFTSDTDGGSAAAYQATTNLAAPPDLKACVVTGVDYNAGTVEVQELAYIPVGVPVLLLTEGDAPHNADFTATVYTVEPGSEADVTANILRRSGGDVSADWGQYYIFSKGEFVLSMGDKTIKEGKYYFENEKYVSGSSPAPAPSRLYISRRGATRINEIVNNIYLTDSWYTLNGQKLNRKPTRKGIYIQNGKKLIVK